MKETMAKTDRDEQVSCEDLMMFINACFACTGQTEFYSDSGQQTISIEFLHSYIAGNYRKLYARTLAAGINHFNKALIILNLLKTGSQIAREHKKEEGRLIRAALLELPPGRVFRIFTNLARLRVNNRRTRAIIKEYITNRPDQEFDAVKYRAKIRIAVLHSHIRFNDERADFLFAGWNKRQYQTSLFETFRQAHYAESEIYNLPFTIAEGLAQKHKVPRDVFLAKIANKMTQAEKLRLQNSAEAAKVKIAIDLSRSSLTKLSLYFLSLDLENRTARKELFEKAFDSACKRILKKVNTPLDKTAAVLDNSYSSSGSSEKRRRPMALSFAVNRLLKAASSEYKPFWTSGEVEDFHIQPKGQTDLASPLVKALQWGAKNIIIVSDGFENDTPGAVNEIVRVFRERFDRDRKVSIIHLNPVFDAENYEPRTLGNYIPTVGLRDGEDFFTALGFAQFAAGFSGLSQLEDYLALLVNQMLEKNRRDAS